MTNENENLNSQKLLDELVAAAGHFVGVALSTLKPEIAQKVVGELERGEKRISVMITMPTPIDAGGVVVAIATEGEKPVPILAVVCPGAPATGAVN